MNCKIIATIVVVSSIVTGLVNVYAAEADAPNQEVKLSPDLLNLLRAEMREIAGGIQNVVLSVATADWESVRETSAQIRSSYIMERELTQAQANELEKALPEYFKQLDADFHHRAEKLGEVAASKDPELVVFHYSRLVESCVRCHSVYARERFPGFAAPARQGHHH